MLRYAITDWSRGTADPEARLATCRESAWRWVRDGVDFVQLREKGLAAGEVFRLAEEFLAARGEAGGQTRLLVNSCADIAVAAGADGVHLTAAVGELTAKQVCAVFAAAGVAKPVVSISCHSLADVSRAREMGVDLVLFGPVFEKVVGRTAVAEGSGLEMLARAAHETGDLPVLALGGVTAENVAACLNAGAAGVAAIRMFES